ncbi:hypothetical protein G7085_11635 [Tessaracoccus sp. HDW20]|uniref:hypothetical protein n=1 Tax=Tessaracoccus coleopterorum TaxID=2714950 RepID=UPI0018D44AFD|nr:hypothetical protein [Tessaracoccus coleopterorum]NHB85039.1 hypothetical protein [Tessaracoccus coleopterorum]
MGVDTDYWTAMDGVRREFSARAQGEGANCNLLMWFSDGEFALNKRPDDSAMQRWGGPKAWVPDNRLRTSADVKAALDAGRSDMCRTGGLADQLRALDIITVGLGLAVDAPPESFELMSGISTGEGCGGNTSPVPGEFLMASDVDDLIFKFITSLERGDEGETPTCVDSECPEGTRTFVLDGSIGAVNATAKAPVDGTRIFLKTRDGDSIELTQGTGEKDLGGSTLSWEWVTPRVLTLDLVRESPDNWAGPWASSSSSTRPPTSSPTRPSRSRATSPRSWSTATNCRPGSGRTRPGSSSAPSTGAASASTRPHSPTRRSSTPGCSRGQDDRARVRPRQGEIEEPIELDLDGLSPGVAELVLTLDVTTQSWEEGGRTTPGTRLEPRHASIPLNILPPFDFPPSPTGSASGRPRPPTRSPSRCPSRARAACGSRGDDVHRLP